MRASDPISPDRPELTDAPSPETSRWKIAGASVQGQRHQRNGQPCQDAHGCRRLDGGWLVAAVADGAGSAAWSQIGAAVAVESCLEFLSSEVAEPPDDPTAWRARLQAAFQYARTSVVEEADRRELAPRQLACTLIAVVIGPDTTAAMQVGDGASVVVTSDTLQTLTCPSPSEFVEQTTFLVDPRPLSQIVSFELRSERASSVAAFTDGFELLVLRYPDWTPNESVFGRIFELLRTVPEATSAAEIEALLISDAVRARTDDDVTLWAATWVSGSGEDLPNPPE